MNGIELLEGRALLAGVVLPNLPAGSRYQIAFVTVGASYASSPSITDYNTWVASEASRSTSLPAATWKAWISTPSVNARDNAPTYADVPIYNTRGELIAKNTQEFLSPTHRATMAYGPDGVGWPYGRGEVWTGSDYQGLGITGRRAGETVNLPVLGPTAGASVQFGRSNDFTNTSGWVSAGVDSAYPLSKSQVRSVYALSSVLWVGWTTPVAPANLSVPSYPSDRQVSLAWNAPASNGGAAITDYIVQYKNSTASVWNTFPDGISTTTSATVTGLQNGVAYDFRVAAVNAVGTGEYAFWGSLTPSRLPDAPTGLGAVAGNGLVNVSWEAPQSDGGTGIQYYYLQYKRSSAVDWQYFTGVNSGLIRGTSVTVTGLTNGVPYVFRAAAVSGVGVSAFSSATQPVTPIRPPVGATSPSVPRTLLATNLGNSIRLTWASPVTDGRSRILDYIVQYKPASASTWITLPDGVSTNTATLVVKSRLTNGIVYNFRVAAVNAVGTSAFATASLKVVWLGR